MTLWAGRAPLASTRSRFSLRRSGPGEYARADYDTLVLHLPRNDRAGGGARSDRPATTRQSCICRKRGLGADIRRASDIRREALARGYSIVPKPVHPSPRFALLCRVYVRPFEPSFWQRPLPAYESTPRESRDRPLLCQSSLATGSRGLCRTARRMCRPVPYQTTGRPTVPAPCMESGRSCRAPYAGQNRARPRAGDVRPPASLLANLRSENPRPFSALLACLGVDSGPFDFRA